MTKPPPLIPDQVAQYHPPLEPAQVTRDATGAPVAAYAPPISIWVRELTGFTAMSESASGGATRAQFTARFLTRYRTDLRPEGRLSLDARTYEITGVTPAPHTAFRSYLHLHCTQKRA